MSPLELVDFLPGDLLHDCLQMYTGQLPILYYLGLSNAAKKFWHPVLEFCTGLPDSPHFELALREMLWSSLNSPAEGPESYNIWAKLCNSVDGKLRERLFAELLGATIKVNNGDGSKVFWRTLFNKTRSTEDQNKFIQSIVDNIEAIEMNSNNLDATFGQERFFLKILPKLPSDNLVWEVLNLSKRTGFNSVMEPSIFGLLDVTYQKSPPRLCRIHEIVKRHAMDHHGSQVFLDRVEAARLRSIDAASSQQKAMDVISSDKLPNWNSWRKNA